MQDERGLFPYSPTDLCGARVLVMAPHPDDETIGCGGSLALHRRAGDAVRVVFVTSGELGGWGAGDPAAVAARREGEVARALPVLGVDDWVFWREPERNLDAHGRLAARLADEIEVFDPTLLYAPSPLDLHPDHRAVAAAVRRALARSSRPTRVAFYETTFAGPVNTLVDVGAVWSTKEQALAAYESQHASPNDYLSATTGLAQFRALTLGHPTTVAEGLHVVAASELHQSRIWRWQALQETGARGPRRGRDKLRRGISRVLAARHRPVRSTPGSCP